MNENRIIIFDTTLRDGEQSPGASMNTEEKIRIACQLERLNVDVMEVGFAAASRGDFDAVHQIAKQASNASICSLARAVDGDIKADDISYVKEDNKKEVGIEIHSGKNRIVRRMFEHLGYKIVALDRVYFAGLTKKNLPRGKWRYLSESEVNFLKMNSQ